MEKRRCTHDLAAIKAAFSSGAVLRRTKTSARDAAALGMDSEAVVAVIQALNYPRDFEKARRRIMSAAMARQLQAVGRRTTLY